MLKKFKVLIAVMLVVLFGVNCQVLRYLVIDDTASATRVMMHEFYAQDNIDILFVGSSFTSYDIDPVIMDRLLGVNTFNASCAHQTIDTSYALIKEAVRCYDVKQIYLELTDVVARQIERNQRESLTDIYLISDYMKPSVNKLVFLLNASTMQHYPNSFILARRNWEKLFDFAYMKEVLDKKKTEVYKQYAYDNLVSYGTYYAGKGHVVNEDVIEEGKMYSHWAYEPIDYGEITNEWRDALTEIIRFCEKNDIELTLFYPPFSSFVYAREDHDVYIAMVEELIAGSGVAFYDFILCREEYIPDTNTLYFDAAHLNRSGAELFSSLLADFMLGNISADELFYDSSKGKFQALSPTIYGISCFEETVSDGAGVRNMKIISNGDLEYRIFITQTDGDQYMVQDFSENYYFTVPMEVHGICTIIWRMSESPEQVQTVEISF